MVEVSELVSFLSIHLAADVRIKHFTLDERALRTGDIGLSCTSAPLSDGRSIQEPVLLKADAFSAIIKRLCLLFIRVDSTVVNGCERLMRHQ